MAKAHLSGGPALAALAALLWAGTALAAPGAPAGQSVRRGVPVLDLTGYYFGAATLDQGDPGAVNLDGATFRAKAMFGGPIKAARALLMGGLQYDLTRVQFNLDQGTVQGGLTLHSVHLRLAALRRLTPRWGYLFFIRLGLSSDMTGASWADLRSSTGAAVTYRHSERLNLTVGLTYSNNFLQELVLPLIALNYRAPPWRLNVVLPKQAELSYALLPYLELGLRLRAESLRYTIHQTSALGTEYAQLNVMVGPLVRAYLWRGAFAAAEGGYNARYYRVLRGQAPSSSLLTFTGGFAALSLGYMY